MAKKSKTNDIISALLYIAVGILLCVFRAGLLNWAMTAIGIVMIVVGVLKALKKEVISGVILAAVGVVLIMGGWMFVDIILLILGAVLAVNGLLDLFRALKRKNVASTVAAVITMVVGVALIISKWALLDWLFIIIGAVLIVDGVLMALGVNKK